jgi:tetratricopeptide (TPR) repeat protein
MGIGGSKYFPDDQEPSANAVVTTEEYQSSKEYYKELSSVGLGELEETYFELRKDNAMNPSFFFDAAKVFEKNGKIKEACRVMSNLAEINLEDHENLRRVGGFLMEHKEYAFAKSIYQHILKIRNEEPQSFRDYALCLAKLGEYQTAADSLYNLFTSDIAWEFSGIRSTLFTEFNTLLDEHKDEIDISKYEPEYIFKTPVDLRIEITWAMDETDVDLWVIEPDNTKCYYSDRYTKNGGFLSQDMRRGYGPEVYMIKKATTGKYKIRANYFSNRRQKSSIDPQVRCKIYTNYGRPNQQMQENIVKIEVDKGEIDLVEVVIEKAKK